MEMETPAQLSDIPNGDPIVMATEHSVDEGENVFLSDNEQSHNPGILGYSSNYGGVISEEGLVQSQGVPSNGGVAPDTKPLSEAELLPLVRQQLEYYFSKDNMGSDKYLLSQMDGDHYVPISVLGSFNQVKRLTADAQLLIKAIKESNVLQIDPTLTKVRAVPEKRCVLILREIAKDTPKEEIQQLFSKETCPKFISCEFAENDCWYVTFPGEEDAQEAHRHLREEVREFRGNPIRARIKNVAAQHTSSVPKPRQQFPYSMPQVQHMPFYPQQSPGVGVGWPFFDPRIAAAHYPNGYPPQPYTASQGGGRNYSVGSADRGGERRDPANREGGVRRGSTGSGSGKRYDTDKRPVGGGYGGNRFRRDDDRLRNLPNRLRNKRNEEIGQSGGGAGPPVGVATTDRTDKESDPRKDSTGKPLRQQRPPNRPPQQKLDFAPVNFPPLPTSMDVAPPPPPPPPVVSEEGNPRLADIVRGKKQPEGKGAGPQGGPQSPPIVQSSTDTKSVVTDTVTTTTSSSSEPAVLPVTQPARPTTNPKVVSNSKDKPNNVTSTSNSNSSKPPRPLTGNDSKYTPRPSSVGGARGSNGARQRPKEYKKPANSTVAPGNTTKMSPGAVKRTVAPPSPVNVTKEESEEEPLVISPGNSVEKAEKLSYAQMAQQKPKPSPMKQPKSPVSPPGGDNPTHSLSSSPPPPTTTLTNEIQPQ